MYPSQAIGVFDSGIGGLTVVRALMNRLPNEDIVYFGDTARVPYGGKSADTVRQYALQDAEFLIEQGVKILVVACNTVSALAMDVLHLQFSVPIIGVIEPGAREAIAQSVLRKIGVIGTVATVSSDAYRRKLLEIAGDVRVFSRACPMFVPIAEEGWGEHKVAELAAQEYLSDFGPEGIDTLILGCTHYPILRRTIQKTVGPDVVLIDSGESTAKEIERHLTEHGIKNTQEHEVTYRFYVSDVPQKFEQLAEIFLGRPDLRVVKVSIP